MQLALDYARLRRRPQIKFAATARGGSGPQRALYSGLSKLFGSRHKGGMMGKLSQATRDKLKTVSTATICTALFKRGLRKQMIQDVHPLNPSLGNMVGEAFTLRYIPAREDLNPISVFTDPSHP